PRLVVALVRITQVSKLRVFFVGLERVRRRPNSNHRLPSLQIVLDDLQLIVRQIPPPREDNDQIRILDRFDTRNALPDVRLDDARLWINRKQHPAIKPMMLRQNLRQLRQRFLRPVLLIARDEDNLLALAWTILAFVINPLLGGLSRNGK